MQRRIIIIEDESLIAADIELKLVSLGYKVVGKAMNGDKALDLFATRPCDLVLLDINIKGSLSGIDLANILNEKYKIPFVFITSFADASTVANASATIPFGYIVKPFSEKDLRSNIEMALARSDKQNKYSHGVDLEQLEQKYNMILSSRDREILLLLFTGKSYKEVGLELEISINTVKTYQKRLYQKFGVDSRFGLMEKVRM